MRLFKDFEFIIKKSPINLLFGHFLALLLPFLGLLLIIFIGRPFSSAPLLVFMPIIAICAYSRGFSPGMLSTLTSAVLIHYYYYLPIGQSLIYQTPTSFTQFILLIIEGTILSFIFNFRKRKDTILKNIRKRREMDKKIVELEELTEKYQKEIRQRDEFLSIASHELKTPLTSMLLQTQTALYNIKSVSVSQFSFSNLLKMLESVENQTKRLSKMINDLLSVSIITIGNLNLEYEEIDLGKLVAGVLTDFQARIEKENYDVTFESEDKVVGEWDKIRIEQAVSNFISNAIKYGDHKPIFIRVKKHNRFAEFIIKDNGIGIAKQKQKHIFELFQRAVTPEQYKGLGVGLYITQKIVSAHGGTVEVSSSPNKNTTFTMKLPFKKPPKKMLTP